ncbi:NAD-dependent DNA ligase [Vibrio phage D249]|nr:putative DNA ligase (NAD(+)) [Vibrio phage 70E38.1]QZI87958.1 DNA ligase [Vibrio phage 234P1]QZI88128.1 putative DNA ligase (NAD(+)) [Vibrio phage 234P7B]QZI88404.1 putative DNA ligase (NAD(+)) [Vibrio phage 294E48.1]QZI88496.1 putative DNA ligase (NAD(+)) [Vibrio phage 70E35.2]QZI88680.1 putative DNA ligase (NAD(+)) [Vibrio phage 70E35.5a]QZI88865.1 putative DNA ligase (NAD(+)) [Vibrio phage 70E35.6]QZI89156.1 putative DNA ligase (NAD(+)) [Vibrio phage 70E37.1]QZI89312.1 putative DNA li
MKNYIKDLQKAYYAGKPRISNEEYDALVSRFGEDEIGTGGDFKHMFRMYSLDKVYPGRGDVYPLVLDSCIQTAKLDGCAISLLYIEGLRTQGNTRGDGISSPTTFEPWKLDALGIDIMSSIDTPILQITGEVVNTKRVKNERNYASGAMQLQDEAEFKSRVEEGGLVFVAYNVQSSPDKIGLTESYLGDMDILCEVGFNVVTEHNWDDCPQDGIVYRLNDNKAFNAAGFTHKHPKGAFAVKEDEEGVETILLDVVWATGKTGKVTPTAIFEEIVIDDAKISRATLNNAGYIEAMGLEIGDTIQVIRSGGIIPKIIGKV